jgi:hypothetical protein
MILGGLIGEPFRNILLANGMRSLGFIGPARLHVRLLVTPTTPS